MNVDETIPVTETPVSSEEESAVPAAEEPVDVTQRLAEEFLVLMKHHNSLRLVKRPWRYLLPNVRKSKLFLMAGSMVRKA